VPLLEPVTVYSSGGATQFAVARNGTAIYLPSSARYERQLMVVGADGSGNVLPIEAAQLSAPRFAPDGVRIAYHRRTNGRIYVFSTLTGTNIPVSGGRSSSPGMITMWLSTRASHSTTSTPTATASSLSG
jgi:hypothetical protein